MNDPNFLRASHKYKWTRQSTPLENLIGTVYKDLHEISEEGIVVKNIDLELLSKKINFKKINKDIIKLITEMNDMNGYNLTQELFMNVCKSIVQAHLDILFKQLSKEIENAKKETLLVKVQD